MDVKKEQMGQKEQKMQVDSYNPKEAEPRIQAFWEKEGVYRFDKKSKKKIYSIDTPPPTVSGSMHVGHAYSYTQQDVIARFKRMMGYNVFYPFGTDDNGLPTERLIEKLKGVKAKDMGRKEFVELCEKSLKEILPDFVSDWKKIGMSCDWSIYYSTIDKHSRRISQRSFIDLYNSKRTYRKSSPSVWCPECQTAIAQAELDDKEEDSIFNDIVFKSGKENLVVATTRPELLSSCVSVFYNPKDDRYKKLKGKMAKVPLFDFEVPILPDEKADPSKGTGLVMCCTFGDQQDIDWWKQHKLPLKVSIDERGHMTSLAGKYQGIYVKKARKQIIEDLKAAGLLLKQQPIKHIVNVHERCATAVEILVTPQWFVNYLDLKEDFIKQGSKLNWYPKFMEVRYQNWVNGLKFDWAISRQRYFGVPIPVWYCEKCSEVILADKNKLPVDPLTDSAPVKKCPKCAHTKFVSEKDVLDTWATSSLTPTIAVELMPKELHNKLTPMSMRPQAHEIIRTWLFYTLAKSYLSNKELPWTDAMISGYVLDPQGEKMSKSKGNTISPQLMIEKYSGDALRFATCAAKLGEDVPFQEKELVAGTKLINKIWNAAKFMAIHLEEKPKKPKKLAPFDEWLIAKMNSVIKNSTESLNGYEYSRSKQEFELFFWQVFCDNYLEIVKDRLYNSNRSKEDIDSAKYTLYLALLNVVKLLAPIMPHISEELYQKYFAKKEKIKSVHISGWPEIEKVKADSASGDLAIKVLTEVRQFKSQNQKSLKVPVILTLESKDKKALGPFLEDLKAVTAATDVQWGSKLEVKFA